VLCAVFYDGKVQKWHQQPLLNWRYLQMEKAAGNGIFMRDVVAFFDPMNARVAISSASFVAYMWM
jgi:cysteinyl-tRNA synthetase